MLINIREGLGQPVFVRGQFGFLEECFYGMKSKKHLVHNSLVN